jgi:hypothetical protein
MDSFTRHAFEKICRTAKATGWCWAHGRRKPSDPDVTEASPPLLFEGMPTPWGTAQECGEILPGIGWVSTAGHGGMKLSSERNAQVPDYLRRADGWYEEDCEWAIVFCVFAEELQNTKHANAINRNEHRRTLAHYYPDEYERFYGLTLQPGESWRRDRQLWHAAHAHELQAVGAQMVRPDVVGVIACVGGRHPCNHHYLGDLRYFLVAEADYDARGDNPFIVDPGKWTETDERYRPLIPPVMKL